MTVPLLEHQRIRDLTSKVGRFKGSVSAPTFKNVCNVRRPVVADIIAAKPEPLQRAVLKDAVAQSLNAVCSDAVGSETKPLECPVNRQPLAKNLGRLGWLFRNESDIV